MSPETRVIRKGLFIGPNSILRVADGCQIMISTSTVGKAVPVFVLIIIVIIQAPASTEF